MNLWESENKHWKIFDKLQIKIRGQSAFPRLYESKCDLRLELNQFWLNYVNYVNEILSKVDSIAMSKSLNFWNSGWEGRIGGTVVLVFILWGMLR